LDENGVILFWNIGAENIFGYSADEIIGCSANITFVEEDRASHQDAVEIEAAIRLGYAADDRWHLRKDGTRFWASGIMTPAYDEAGKLRGLLKIIRDKTTEKLASERSLYLARHDSLTGLANRSYFYEMLQAATTEARINRSELQVLMLDLDRFKRINDRYGHFVGDQVLRTIAQRAQELTRDTDVLGRLGGEEFALVLPDTDLPLALDVAERLRTVIGNTPINAESDPIFCTSSFGVAALQGRSKSLSALLAEADDQLLFAKRNGRNRIEAGR